MKKIIVELTPEVAADLVEWITSLKHPSDDETSALSQITSQLRNEAELSTLEWHHPEVKGNEVFDIPDEGEAVLVRRKVGDYLVDTVLADLVGDHFVYWLDQTQDWEEVDAWARLSGED